MIGFAAETDALLEHARAKRVAKSCDWIVANDVGTEPASWAARTTRSTS